MQTTSRDLTPAEREKLRSHVVNLRQGRFSTDGDFITTKQDVEHIFAVDLPAALAAAKADNRKLRLLFYAHGGLVSEASGIAGALGQVDFWKANHVYPIFFIWETGILEVLADLLRKVLAGQRGLSDFLGGATAKVLESLARPGGVRVWGSMKLSAQAASSADGGARVVARLAGQFCGANAADVEVHACGHSAGAIFHAFFLPALVEAKVNVASLALLAPGGQPAYVQVQAGAARRQRDRSHHHVHDAPGVRTGRHGGTVSEVAAVFRPPLLRGSRRDADPRPRGERHRRPRGREPVRSGAKRDRLLGDRSHRRQAGRRPAPSITATSTTTRRR